MSLLLARFTNIPAQTLLTPLTKTLLKNMVNNFILLFPLHLGCNVIKAESNFTVCHKAVAPEPYIEACEQESCLCKYGGDCACFCSAVAAYVQECNKHGIPIHWRKEGLCRKYCRHFLILLFSAM